MAQNDPKSPWSDDQIQSTTGGAPDSGPWRLTLAVILILTLLLVAGYFLWRAPGSKRIPAAPAPTAGQ